MIAPPYWREHAVAMLELEIDPSITSEAERARATEEMKEIVRMWDRILMEPSDVQPISAKAEGGERVEAPEREQLGLF